DSAVRPRRRSCPSSGIEGGAGSSDVRTSHQSSRARTTGATNHARSTPFVEPPSAEDVGPDIGDLHERDVIRVKRETFDGHEVGADLCTRYPSSAVDERIERNGDRVDVDQELCPNGERAGEVPVRIVSRQLFERLLDAR